MMMQSLILQILLERRRAAAAERGAQTGHRRAMSNSGLVLDLNDARAPVKSFFIR